MSKEQSVLNLLVEKDKYKNLSEEYKEVLEWILTKCYSIGAPLNDNTLKFNNKQLLFLINIVKEINSVI